MSTWNAGPDALAPASSYTSTRLSDPVKLRYRYKHEDLAPIRPVSVYTVLRERARQTPKKVALVVKRNDENIQCTYQEYFLQSNLAAKGFIKLGLQQHQAVCILGFNSPEWMISLYGAVFAGGVASGIYTTNTPDACAFIIKDCSCQIVVVENQDQLKKILKIKDSCNIKAVIQYTGEVADSHNGLVISWNDFMKLGSSVGGDQLIKRIRGIAPNKCATLIYTSGTTGNPKAAMLSHDNINYAYEYVRSRVGGFQSNERLVSFLPLSHVAAQLVDVFSAVKMGATVIFAQPDAMKGSLGATLVEAKPTIFFGVPRVWEKMQEKMMAMAKTGAKVSPEKVKHLLGLGEARGLYSGAAPVKATTVKFFENFGIKILDVFGMSECSGPHTVALPYHHLAGSVGHLVTPFYRTKISNPDKDGNGEVCMYGRHVMMGYLNNEKKTEETIDSEGWLLSGDIGRVDQHCFLYITGRLKELVITAGGENIAPVAIEDSIVAAQPDLISNCMVVGDHKNYLTLLVALKAKLDPNTTASLDELSDEAVAYLKKNGSTKTKLSEILADGDEVVDKGIQDAIDKANAKAVSRAWTVQKFTILPRDFSLATGELGPTLKLRRPIVHKMYDELIQKMY